MSDPDANPPASAPSSEVNVYEYGHRMFRIRVERSVFQPMWLRMEDRERMGHGLNLGNTDVKAFPEAFPVPGDLVWLSEIEVPDGDEGLTIETGRGLIYKVTRVRRTDTGVEVWMD